MANPSDQQNRNRRVSDQSDNAVSFDAAHQAVRMERLEGKHDLLSQQVKGSIDTCTSALNNVQIEVRTLSSGLQKFANMQQSHENNTSAISDVKSSVSDLSRKLESWMSEFERKNEQNWNQYRIDRDSWRASHERLNEETKDSLNTRITAVRETTIRILAWAGGAGALVAVIGAGFLWSLNDRFSALSRNISEVREVSNTNNQRVTQLDTRHTEKIHSIELYLARGGQNRTQPYIPPNNQERNDE